MYAWFFVASISDASDCRVPQFPRETQFLCHRIPEELQVRWNRVERLWAAIRKMATAPGWRSGYITVLSVAPGWERSGPESEIRLHSVILGQISTRQTFIPHPFCSLIDERRTKNRYAAATNRLLSVPRHGARAPPARKGEPWPCVPADRQDYYESLEEVRCSAPHSHPTPPRSELIGQS